MVFLLLLVLIRLARFILLHSYVFDMVSYVFGMVSNEAVSRHRSLKRAFGPRRATRMEAHGLLHNTSVFKLVCVRLYTVWSYAHTCLGRAYRAFCLRRPFRLHGLQLHTTSNVSVYGLILPIGCMVLLIWSTKRCCSQTVHTLSYGSCSAIIKRSYKPFCMALRGLPHIPRWPPNALAAALPPPRLQPLVGPLDGGGTPEPTRPPVWGSAGPARF